MKQIALLNVVGLTQSVDGLHRTKKKWRKGEFATCAHLEVVTWSYSALEM